MNQKHINVNILNKQLPVSCPEGEESKLYQSARYLNDKIELIVSGQRTPNVELATLMTALNITHELISLEQKFNEAQSRHNIGNQSLVELLKKTESALELSSE